jgi:nucleoside-diphosphate-sugar epimerase
MATKYLVTGGAGFIGSNIVHSLVKKQAQVRVIDNLSTGDEKNLDGIRSEIEFMEGDICNPNTIKKATEGIDYIIHQAALPSVPRSIDNPNATHESNINGTLSVLLAARDQGVKRVVFAGSSSAYGESPELPKKENMLPAPLSPYAATKLAGEFYCQTFSTVYGLETLTLRYFNVFGPRQNPESQYAAVIPKFITILMDEKSPTIYGDGEQTRDFTYVENVVSANILACQVEKTAGEVINIATSQRISLNQLYTLLTKIVKKDIPAKYAPARTGDVKHSLADITLAEKLLGYRPSIDLKEGLEQTVAWFMREK